jgi:hypothetical protein
MAMKTIALALFALLAAGCDRPGVSSGGMCGLNSDCMDPLVCGLERCRRQCLDSRDCAAGLSCLLIGDLGGVCQLPDERECSLTSDCTPGLACRFGTCTTECVQDRDCPPGAECLLDEGEGEMACVEISDELCIYNSDCEGFYICGPDQRCRHECEADVDCDALRFCNLENFRCYPRADGGT